MVVEERPHKKAAPRAARGASFREERRAERRDIPLSHASSCAALISLKSRALSDALTTGAAVTGAYRHSPKGLELMMVKAASG
jgi:hypothetical protein